MRGRLQSRRITVSFVTLLIGLSILQAPVGAASPNVVISQVYGGGGNSGATYTHDFVELFNRSSEPVALDGWSVQYASATGTGHFASNVAALGGTLQPGQYHLVQMAAGAGGTTPLPAPDSTGSVNMAAGAGKVVVADTTTGLACNGGATPCSSEQLADIVDLVGYGSANFFEGAGAAPTASNTTAVVRAGGGCSDSDDNAADFSAGPPAPRNSASPVNDCAAEPPPDDCATAASHEIAEVQGPGASTPVAGQSVRVEGVVTGDFQGPDQLGGFFVQDDTPDADPATSEGLFAATSEAVAVGDRVFVTGTAGESFGLTQVTATGVDVCGTGTISPATYDLPRPEGTTFEPVEGVLLTFPETLTATEHFQLGRFGELTVSSDGRLFQPTDRFSPGPEAEAMLELSARRRLLIDDGSNVQNPSTIPFVAPGAAVRIGDSASGITGVLSFGFSNYRLQPTAPITFTRSNPRPASPEPVGGDIRVASFNTLNYFTTLTTENANARGANSPEEFDRQQIKEVAAITGLDADVIGLMEVENNGATAITSLVDALNDATAPGTYAHITEPALNDPNEFGGTFGTDAIKVAIIYRPAAVTPLGTAQTSADAVFDRPPLIQTFELAGGSEPFTVAVNHFKSKGCGGATGADTDQGDGQSCFNARRTQQADTLASVLDGLDVPNPLVIGDLNAYTEEDPIHALEAAGYTGLSELFTAADPDGRYSFVFDGFSGELDHALAGPDLLDNVTGVSIWHVNADEPLVLDYNLDFDRSPALFEPNAYRSSDHDPLVLGLDLISVPAAPTVSARAGWGAATVEWAAPDDGGGAISGYSVQARAGDAVVASAAAGPDARSHTFGELGNGVPYSFEVAANNEAGSGPAGAATATPFVPDDYEDLDVRVDCPAFVVDNPNDFPISVAWTTSRRGSGSDVVPAEASKPLDAPTARRGATVLFLSAGGEFQDFAIAFCRSSRR